MFIYSANIVCVGVGGGGGGIGIEECAITYALSSVPGVSDQYSPVFIEDPFMASGGLLFIETDIQLRGGMSVVHATI